MATAMRDAVLGVFRDPDSVASAIDGLRRAGVSGRDLKVLSDTPYPEGAFGEDREPHRLYVFPFVGALCGFSVALLLTVGTQLAYPMVTGGKPIISIPPMIHIMYEGTMLGAIMFTIMGIIFESRLPDFGEAPYDPRISEGYLGLLVARAGGRTDAATRALQDAGAVDIITRENGRVAR
jgi:hypothetical protein